MSQLVVQQLAFEVLVCLMFVAFKQVAPDHDVGFDLEREYEMAKAMHSKQDKE